MEQEFDVEIKEVLSRVQKVKAESLDDAINKARLTCIFHQREVICSEDKEKYDCVG